MVLDIENDLKKLSGVAKVRVILVIKVTDTTSAYIAEVYETLVGNILVKSGGGKKGGRRLGAALRRKVVAHLESGGTVTMTVL